LGFFFYTNIAKFIRYAKETFKSTGTEDVISIASNLLDDIASQQESSQHGLNNTLVVL